MKYLFSLIALVIAFPLFAQVVENPGFEEWEEISNGNSEPVNWSSIQTATPDNLAALAPQALFKDSIDPHTGNYCVHVKSIYVTIAQIVANGIITNGRILADFIPENGDSHTDSADNKWNTVCDTRPDSLVGYYKYIPAEDDKILIRALLHKGGIGKLPDVDSTGWVGLAVFNSTNEDTDGWVRFSVPFTYFNEEMPDYILFNLSCSNAYEAVAGSEAWFDDIELVWNPVGIDENFANSLLSAYAIDNEIIIDLRKFGAGEVFNVEIYSTSGQLVVSDKMVSGNTDKWKIEDTGVYICKLHSKDGLTLTKKVFVQ
jgi:hypothetical protein